MIVVNRTTCSAVCTRDCHYSDNRAEPQSPFKHNNRIHHNPIRTYPASNSGKWCSKGQTPKRPLLFLPCWWDPRGWVDSIKWAETNGARIRRRIQILVIVDAFNLSRRGLLQPRLIDLRVLPATPLGHQSPTPRVGVVWVHTIARFCSRRFNDLHA